ncbi:MAG TPA: carboxypeptidase-like regulatory domain-containing protein [Methylomirabilota bacterium]|nr:carboxypeptidase-like regulatory domain-containing protein [Methylomirabilota bacterium]
MTSRLRPFLALAAAVVVACQASSPPPSIAPKATVAIRTLAVIVTMAAGAPVVGANVCAFTVAGAQERCGETSGSGTARLGLRPGTYSVLVTPHAPTRLAEGQTWVDVLDADATSVVQLDPHSRINGTIRDARGTAVTDAEVCAHPPQPLASPTCARSAAEGKFSIDVRSDVYKLDVTGPPGGKLIAQWASGKLSSGDADLVDVRSADVDGIGVTMVKGVLLSGVVRGPSGPIEDAQICTRTLAAPLPWDCVRTNKKGSYLALMEPGQYFMLTVPPDNVRLVAQWYDDVLEGVNTTDIAMDRDREIDVELHPGPQLRGKVTTTEGAPVSGAFVCVDTRFPTGRICRPTAGDGSYTVTTRPQTYTVQVLAPPDSDLINEFWLRKRTWVDANDVSLGNADRTLDLTLRHGMRVSGVIRDTRGVPLEGATINLNDEEGPFVGTDTDISGSYHMVVPAGTYQIEVFAPFRGERGDFLSQAPRELLVNGYINYDAVLEDANP